MAFILVLSLSCIYLYEVVLIYHEKKKVMKVTVYVPSDKKCNLHLAKV